MTQERPELVSRVADGAEWAPGELPFARPADRRLPQVAHMPRLDWCSGLRRSGAGSRIAGWLGCLRGCCKHAQVVRSPFAKVLLDQPKQLRILRTIPDDAPGAALVGS